MPCAVAVALLAGAGAAAAGTRDHGGAVNLIAAPAVKAGLRTAFLAAHPHVKPRGVKGPLPGRTYYGGYRGREYAIATFSIPLVGTTDQPELFVRKAGGRWVDKGDTGGEVCPGWMPVQVIRIWELRPAGDCYLAP